MLDLATPRDLGQILNECWRLYRAHFAVFAVIAFAVVVPFDVITLGLIEGHLTGGFDVDHLRGGPATTVVHSLIVTPLITAGHVSAVIKAGRGERPTAGESLSEAGAMLRPLIGVVLLYTLGVLVGFVALVLPGIYLTIRWYVASQAVVAEGLGPVDALKRSGELVEGGWWRVFGITFAIGLVAFTVGALAGVPVGGLAAALDSGPLLVLGNILADAVILSFTALAGTLLFFDLRARKHLEAPQPPAFPPAPLPPDPERPAV